MFAEDIKKHQTPYILINSINFQQVNGKIIIVLSNCTFVAVWLTKD